MSVFVLCKNCANYKQSTYVRSLDGSFEEHLPRCTMNVKVGSTKRETLKFRCKKFTSISIKS